MNSQQAKVILLRSRPGTRDELDPDVSAALAAAAQDPELARWLENHRQFQRSLLAGVRDVKLPTGLKEQILSERRAFFSLRRVPRRTMVAGVAAAVLGLILAGFLILPHRADTEAQLATFRSRMVRTVLRGYAMDIETRSPAEIRSFLHARNAHGDWQSIPALDQKPLLGCAVLSWRSRPAAMICYGSAKVPELWLFVVDSIALPDAPADGVLEFARENRLNTICWSHGGKTYILAGALEKADLQRLLSGGG